MKHQLVYFGNPVLRKKAEPVTAFDATIKDLVEEMKVIMQTYNGIGLAAPQVGVSKRIFITQVPVELEDGNWKEGELLVFINPTLSTPSEETNSREEGCLSIPEVYVSVERPLSIHVHAFSVEGTPFEATYTDLQARCCMHENDHINGVLMIDRTDKKRRKQIEPLLQKLKQKKPT